MPRSELEPNERVVITGMGCVTPLGLDVQSTWKSLIAGKDSMADIRDSVFADYKQFETSVGAPILGFDLFAEALDRETVEALEPKDLRRIHRSAQFVIWAALEALGQAKLLNDRQQIDPGQVDPDRVGIRMGTSVGGAVEIGEVRNRIDQGKTERPPAILQILPERVATVSSMYFNIRGPASTAIGACSTGNMNIISAADVLTHRKNRADVMIAGAADAVLTPVGVAIFEGAGAVDSSEDPGLASRPFHSSQGGLIMGEGAGVLVLETLENARRRGAVVLAELAGYAESSDAYHPTLPSGEGAERAMIEALADAGITPEDRIAINAHATGTKGDGVEMESIRAVFDGKTYRQAQIVGISSVKGAIGHTLGAAGAIESIVAVMSLREGVVPPSLKMSDSPIPETAGWPMSPDKATEVEGGIDAVVNNSFGFGGLNAVTVYTKAF